MRIRDHQPHTLQAPALQVPQKRRPEGRVLRRAGIDAEHLALAVGRHADRDDRRHRAHPTVLADLVVGRIDPEVGMLPADRPRAERLHLGVQRRAHPRHLGLRDALEPERLHEPVDLPG